MRLRTFSLTAVLFACAASSACQKSDAPEIRNDIVAVHTAAPPSSAPPAPPSSRLARPAPERLVAIGDVHGDLGHLKRALVLAGAIDAQDHWTGGKLVVAQTGDEIDRGDDDRAILDFVEALKAQAAAAGGEVLALLGNHEIMNASLDFRYVTSGGFTAFAPFAHDAVPGLAEHVPAEALGRAAAFSPGGTYAKMLAHRPVVAVVGGTVFVHGGVLPKHVTYGLDRMNDELDEWLAGKRHDPPAVLVAEDGPVWTREYSNETGEPECADLTRALHGLDAKRMVVGHTVQRQGLNSACGGAVWRIDAGLSHFYGGPIQVLEIRGEQVKVLKESGAAAPTSLPSDRRTDP